MLVTGASPYRHTRATMNLEEAAAYLGISVRHLQALRAKEQVPYTKIGRALRFRRADLDLWLEDNSFYPDP